MTLAWLGLALLLSGCALEAADHERLGDRAYGDGRFGAAVAEYRAAEASGGRPRLWAKLAAAALHNRDFGIAIESYAALASTDPSRAAEAATGLERVAQQAVRGGHAEVSHLAAAVRALRTVAPGRPLGRFAPVATTGLPASELIGALPAALAWAPDARSMDSLLAVYGTAQRVTTACESATRTLRTVLRRSRDAVLRSRAADGMSSCALRLGLDALNAEQAEVAERWFESAMAGGSATPSGWRAAIGLGDARILQGDILGAALAYQGVLSATGVPDSLVKMATAKLNALGGTPPPRMEGMRE